MKKKKCCIQRSEINVSVVVSCAVHASDLIPLSLLEKVLSITSTNKNHKNMHEITLCVLDLEAVQREIFW